MPNCPIIFPCGRSKNFKLNDFLFSLRLAKTTLQTQIPLHLDTEKGIKMDGPSSPGLLRTCLPLAPTLLRLPPGWFLDKFIAVFTRKPSAESCFWSSAEQADSSSGVPWMKGCRRGFGNASQRDSRLYIRQQNYCLGKTSCVGDFGNCREVLQEFKEAHRKEKTQPTFIEYVLCGGFPIKPFQVIVSRNPQNPSGLSTSINPQRLNNPLEVTK